MATSAGILVQQEVRFRGDDGRFLAEVDAAVVASSDQLAQAIEQLASATAWDDSGPVTAQSHGFSATATAFGRTAAIQEFGAAPHRIEPGLDHGYLANQATGFGPVKGGVSHPGVKARRFLSNAGRAVSAMGPALIAKNFPR